MPKTFDEAVADLAAAAKKMGDVGETMDRAAEAIMDAALKSAAKASGGGVRGEDEGRGFFGRLWDRSRIGRAYKSGSEGYRSAMGSSGPTHTGGLGRMGGMAAKGFGAAAVLVEAAKQLNDFRKAVEAATSQQLESYRKLAEVSGGMSAVMAQRDVQNMLRDMKRGDALAPSAQRLADAESRRKDAMEPILTKIDEIYNSLLAKVNDWIADGTNWGTDKLNQLIEALTFGAVKDFIAKNAGEAGDPAFFAGLNNLTAEIDKIEEKARKDLDDAKAEAAKKLPGRRPPPNPARRPLP